MHQLKQRRAAAGRLPGGHGYPPPARDPL